MKRILIVNVNWLGDAVMTTPLFKAIKEALPSCYLAVMVVPRLVDVFSQNPYIDEIIIFDAKTLHRSFKEKLKFAKFLKEKNFDTAFLIHRSFTRAFILWLAGIKSRIGYRRLKNFFVLTKKIEPPPKNLHRQDYYLYLFENCGFIIKDRFPKIFFDDSDRLEARDFVFDLKRKHKFVVGINPAGNWKPKRWPASYFARLADELIDQLNASILFVGSAKDIDVVNEVINNMKNTAINLAGKTTIKKLAALMEYLDLFISNDSGPAHIAASQGTNTIVIFGPTSDKITSPIGRAVKIIKKPINCIIPCYKKNCLDNICMKNILPSQVFLEAKTILLNR
ncbi:MAG: lipopolysaccharide heptosyltransferase II [Candidatus Omnitrophica bacterium]|nr:lipopolysaccharide heptosyltransferase II [Candidatus Omnitrophota bacterium]MCM8831247.1 lipopolysaccharide heptosyltransferase II [Candidatus Omnitrophota bacterium]